MVMVFKCKECLSRFYSKYNLLTHFKKRHPTLELPKFKKKQLKVIGESCEACNLEFSCRSSLSRHVKNFHSTEDNQKTSKNDKRPKKYKCIECSAEYMNSNSLNRHVRLKHNRPNLEMKKLNTINCSLCTTSFTQKDDLFKHWELEHSISIETEQLQFVNKHMFFSWKNNVESATHSKFVRNIPGYSSHSGKTEYFQCNRSGYFNSKSKGLRHLKMKGTCKINSICPARMKVRVLEDGKHVVQYTKTHVGHEHDLGHLSLSQVQRETLAKKIASHISFDKILDDVRESFDSNLQYGRIHLLTRKDLHNIKQSLNIVTNTIVKTEVENFSEVDDVEDQSTAETYRIKNEFEDNILTN